MATQEIQMAEFRTKDLPLATMLNMCGFTHQRMDKMGKSAVWIFDRSEPLMERVDEFQAGESLVEPAEFQRVLYDVRGEMYEFLGVGRRDGNARS